MNEGFSLERAFDRVVICFRDYKRNGTLPNNAEIRSVHLCEACGYSETNHYTYVSIGVDYVVDGQCLSIVFNVKYVDAFTPLNVYCCEHYL